jgi:hypothetical protein
MMIETSLSLRRTTIRIPDPALHPPPYSNQPVKRIVSMMPIPLLITTSMVVMVMGATGVADPGMESCSEDMLRL